MAHLESMPIPCKVKLNSFESMCNLCVRLLVYLLIGKQYSCSLPNFQWQLIQSIVHFVNTRESIYVYCVRISIFQKRYTNALLYNVYLVFVLSCVWCILSHINTKIRVEKSPWMNKDYKWIKLNVYSTKDGLTRLYLYLIPATATWALHMCFARGACAWAMDTTIGCDTYKQATRLRC